MYFRIIVALWAIAFSLDVQSQVAPGTVVWSEDFDSGLPSTWEVFNTTNNNYNWLWDTVYKQGMFTRCLSSIKSTTAANGFMQMPMDFYNTPLGGTGSAMNAYLSTSVVVPSSGNLTLRFQQFVSYCCSGSGIQVQMSSDSLSWTTFDVSNNLWINRTSRNVVEVNLPIPSAMTVNNKLYLRFHVNGLTHYYWMIDDVEIVHSYTSATSVESVGWSIGSMPRSLQVYPVVPAHMMDTMIHDILIQNRGTLVQSSVKLRSSVLQNSAQGTILHVDSTNYPNLGVDSSANIQLKSNYVITTKGEYLSEVEVFTSPANQLSSRKKITHPFRVSDTILSKNRTIESCFIDFELSSSNKLGAVYKIGNQGGDLTSISVYVASMFLNVNASLKAELWSFNSAAPTLAQQVGTLIASSPVDTLDSTDFSNWKSFPLSNPVQLAPNSEYLVVISNTAPSSQFSVFSTPMYYKDFENLGGHPIESYIYDPIVGVWDTSFYAYANFYVDLNFGNLLTVGIPEEAKEPLVKIYPNPSTGTLRVDSPELIRELQIFDVKGRLLFTQAGVEKIIQLEGLMSGLYLLQIQFENGKVKSEKVVLNR